MRALGKIYTHKHVLWINFANLVYLIHWTTFYANLPPHFALFVVRRVWISGGGRRRRVRNPVKNATADAWSTFPYANWRTIFFSYRNLPIACKVNREYCVGKHDLIVHWLWWRKSWQIYLVIIIMLHQINIVAESVCLWLCSFQFAWNINVI